jgi:hypothetical protein
MEIKSYLPIFPGFYGSQFEFEDEERILEDLNEESEVEISYENIDFDYKEYHDRVAKRCCDEIENYLKHDYLDITITFEEVISPREYNFTNDYINCTYNLSDETFKTLIEYCKRELQEFTAFLIEKYSSRSGFISFFSTEPEIWFNEYLKEDDEKFIRAFAGILEFYLKNEAYNEYSLYCDIQEETSYIDYEIKE